MKRREGKKNEKKGRKKAITVNYLHICQRERSRKKAGKKARKQ